MRDQLPPLGLATDLRLCGAVLMMIASLDMDDDMDDTRSTKSYATSTKSGYDDDDDFLGMVDL